MIAVLGRICVASSILLIALPLYAEDNAQPAPEIKVVEEKLASAGNWDNFRNNPGSLRYESGKLFQKGHQLLTSSSPAEQASALIIESVPNVFLSEYEEKEKCEEKLLETKDAPIVFDSLSFNSIDSLAEWFSDLSTGSGKEGKQLYAMCDGSCSPQYNLLIKESQGNLNLKATILCGPARDKKDNLYKLTLSTEHRDA